MLFEGCRTAEGIAEVDAQVGFLEHVQQAGHGPPSRQVRLEREEVFRLRPRIQGKIP
jgi:hypothetical protein